jgi:hypothetical protein
VEERERCCEGLSDRCLEVCLSLLIGPEVQLFSDNGILVSWNRIWDARSDRSKMSGSFKGHISKIIKAFLLFRVLCLISLICLRESGRLES